MFDTRVTGAIVDLRRAERPIASDMVGALTLVLCFVLFMVCWYPCFVQSPWDRGDVGLPNDVSRGKHRQIQFILMSRRSAGHKSG